MSSKPSSTQIWHGVIGNGQSLSVGFQGGLPKPLGPVPHAFKLADTANEYDIYKPDAATLRLVPLEEPFRPREGGGDGYPRNIDGLSPHRSMACVINHMHAAVSDKPDSSYVTVHSAVGKGGALMHDIWRHGQKDRTDSGSNSYAASVFEARALHRLAKTQGAQLQYGAIILTHGEADALMNNEEYDDDVLKMQADYAHDLQEITGQHHDPLLILSQQNTCPPHRKFLPAVADAMWRVQSRAPDKVVCSGPKYQYEYAPGGLHLDWTGYSRLGEKYGQVYYETVVLGKPFFPLHPKSAALSRDRRRIAVKFHVLVPPLRWDETLPRPHNGTNCADYWADGRGFEVRDGRGKRVAIRHALICDDEESVAIDLAGTEAEDGEEIKLPLNLAYAMTQQGEGFGPGFCGGTSEGRMGQLCDTDPGPGLEATLQCSAQRGSSEIFNAESWYGRAKYDLIEPGGFTICSIEGCTATVDKPWTGSSGAVELRVRHNQRNYCVAFSMDVDP